MKNLIRFDWAIKRLLRNKANFEVLEGFLSVLFKKNIIIKSILESEGNQKNETDKYNRVDMLVEDNLGELMIIEIQNQNEYDYFQRMIYGTAKVISDYISLGDAYGNIKKVYSVNIVYFDLGHGEDYVYHGKTDFKGIHKSDILSLSDKQKEIFRKTEPSQVFPEYYVLKVNQFNNIAKDSLDEWVYYLKNSDIKADFTAPGLLKAKELLSLNTLSETERKQYIRYLEGLSLEASLANTMKIDEEDRIKKEIERARQEERKLGKIELEKAKEEERKLGQIEIEKAKAEARKLGKIELEKAKEEERKLSQIEIEKAKAEARKLGKIELEKAKEEERKLGKIELEKAKEEERKLGQIEIAKNALKESIDIEIIKKITGLSDDEIKKLM